MFPDNMACEGLKSYPSAREGLSERRTTTTPYLDALSGAIFFHRTNLNL